MRKLAIVWLLLCAPLSGCAFFGPEYIDDLFTAISLEQDGLAIGAAVRVGSKVSHDGVAKLFAAKLEKDRPSYKIEPVSDMDSALGHKRLKVIAELRKGHGLSQETLRMLSEFSLGVRYITFLYFDELETHIYDHEEVVGEEKGEKIVEASRVASSSMKAKIYVYDLRLLKLALYDKYTASASNSSQYDEPPEKGFWAAVLFEVVLGFDDVKVKPDPAHVQFNEIVGKALRRFVKRFPQSD